MRIFIFIFMLFSFSVFAHPMLQTKEYTFETGSQSWTGDFTDYPRGQEEFYELSWGWENIPINQEYNANLPNFKKGIFLSGNNHSDDLFMYIKSPVSGLKPNTHYTVTLFVNLASNASPGSIGVGGAEGESVYLKVGASTIEPKTILTRNGYVFNIDKGNQKTGGKNAVVVGNLANPLVDPNHPHFAPLQVDNLRNPIFVKSDEKGQLWVLVGTDSGFEATSKYYIGKIKIIFHENK